MNLTITEQVYRAIQAKPGITMPELAEQIRVDHPIYGRQRAISSAVAWLRKQGRIQDVAERCQTCNCALTRSRKNVPLYLTVEAQ